MITPGWTWVLEVTGGSKDEVGDAHGQCSHAGTVDAGWVITRESGELGDACRREKSWAVMDLDPDSLWSGCKVGLCDRLSTC